MKCEFDGCFEDDGDKLDLAGVTRVCLCTKHTRVWDKFILRNALYKKYIEVANKWYNATAMFSGVPRAEVEELTKEMFALKERVQALVFSWTEENCGDE